MPDRPLILIVDDDPAMAMTLKALLAGEGYRLTVTHHGRQALELAEREPPDAVLLDVMMPDMDGFEVCERMRAHPLLAEAPILMVTALDDRHSRLQGLQAGADDFLTKPVDRLELQARLRTITRLGRYRRLLAERQRLSWVLEQSGDGYVVLDHEDRIVQSNPRARLYLGLATAEVTEEPFLTIVKREYQLAPEAAWICWPLSEATPRYLVRPETATAAAFWLEVGVLRHAGLPEAERIIQLRDVTEQITTSQGIRAFHVLVAHKLRAPLTGLMGGLDLLAHDAALMPVTDLQELAMLALDGARRLHQTVESVLRCSQFREALREGGGCSLGEIAASVMQMAHALNLSDVAAAALPPELETVRIALGPRAMELIVLELLGNAQKFHPRQTPAVRLSISPEAEGRVRLRVEDDGLHLSPEQLAQAFVPYAQGEKYFTGEVAGLGLGLAQVATLVWSVGGSVRIYNRNDAMGVAVELALPVVGE